jgi:hypothetical protein
MVIDIIEVVTVIVSPASSKYLAARWKNHPNPTLRWSSGHWS